MARLRNARATSAGGIVVRSHRDRPQLVLGRRRTERDRIVWSLPKGTPRRDETLDQTAVREVSEETGLHVRIVAPLGQIQYWFVRRGTRFAKTVHYYLMEAVGGDLEHHDREFDAVEWVDFEALPGLDLFPTERELIEQTRFRLAAQPDPIAS